MEVQNMEVQEVPEGLTTPTMDLSEDWGHGGGSPEPPVEDQQQQQADITKLLDNLGNFPESENVTSIDSKPNEDKESSHDSQDDYEKSGIDMAREYHEEEEPTQDVKTEKGLLETQDVKMEKGLLERLQDAERVKIEAERPTSKEKEKVEEEVINIYNSKSEEKERMLKKVNKLATDLSSFVKFENTTFTLAKQSKEQLEMFAIPVAELLLKTVCNSKILTSAEWAKSEASKIMEQVQKMPHGDIPLKALAKNAQAFLLSNLLDNLTQVKEIIGDTVEDKTTVEDLKTQLTATLQLNEVTADLLKRKKEELNVVKEDQKRAKIEVQKQTEQNEKWKKDDEEKAEAHEHIKKKYEELKTIVEKVNVKKMNEEISNLKTSLASGNQTINAQMMLIQGLQEAAEEKDNMIAAYKISMEQEVPRNTQAIKELRVPYNETYPELAKKPKLAEGIEIKKESPDTTHATTTTSFTTYAEKANRATLKTLLEKKVFRTFNYHGPEMFSARSVEEAVRGVEFVQDFISSMMNEIQKSWPKDFRNLYYPEDEGRADEAFKLIMKRLSKARGTNDLRNYLARNKDNKWTEPENETLKRKNITFFQQFPNISPSRKMFHHLLWNEDTKALHIHAVLGLLSLYAPRLYVCLVKWDMAASENMRRKFAAILNPRGTSPWYQALHVLCLIVMDQADVVEVSFGFKTGHNLAKRPFNGKMVPADDPVLTEEVLQEIKESRPVSYTMEELRTIFCDNDFSSFKEVYTAERTRVKEIKAESRVNQKVIEDLSMFE